MVTALLALGACNSASDGGGSAAPTTVAPVVTTGATAATGGGGGEYCVLARSYAKAFERFGQQGTPAEQRAYYQTASADIQKAVQVAPPGIKADVETVADTLQSLVTALESINYDFARVASLPPDLIVRLMNQQFTAAATRVATYSRDKCGIA